LFDGVLNGKSQQDSVAVLLWKRAFPVSWLKLSRHGILFCPASPSLGEFPFATNLLPVAFHLKAGNARLCPQGKTTLTQRAHGP
jgi:hypothetical protein